MKNERAWIAALLAIGLADLAYAELALMPAVVADAPVVAESALNVPLGAAAVARVAVEAEASARALVEKPAVAPVVDAGPWTILFGTNEDVAGASPAFSAAVALLAADAKMELEVRGHADRRGRASFNLTLSSRRASAVLEELVRLGADRSRLHIVALGESRPAAEGVDPEALAKNRRVEILPRRVAR